MRTAAELAAACEREFDACDVLLMAAAVADFRPRDPAATKLKKDRGAPASSSSRPRTSSARLAPRRRPRPGPGRLRGRARRAGGDRAGRPSSSASASTRVVVNDISQPGIGFDAAENEVTIVLADGRVRHVAKTGKQDIAASGARRGRVAVSWEGDRRSSHPSTPRRRRKSLRRSPRSRARSRRTSRRRSRSAARRSST